MSTEELIVILAALFMVAVGLWRIHVVVRFLRRVLGGKG